VLLPACVQIADSTAKKRSASLLIMSQATYAAVPFSISRKSHDLIERSTNSAERTIRKAREGSPRRTRIPKPNGRTWFASCFT